MATQHALAANDASHRAGMVKRLSFISMSFLERILKTSGPYDHDQWPHEPTTGPINPGMLSKISRRSSEEYLDLMRESDRDALAEFDGRLLRQVIRNVIYQSLSVSRKSPRHTSPSNARSLTCASSGGGSGSQFTSPSATPRDFSTSHHHAGGGGGNLISPVPFSGLSPDSARSQIRYHSSSSGGRFMVLHPAKAEAMIFAKRMLDPLLQSAKFPKEAYKVVVMEVGEQFMERFHPSEAELIHQQQHNNTNIEDDYSLTVSEREYITATVLSLISKIVENEDGSIMMNGKIVAFAPSSSSSARGSYNSNQQHQQSPSSHYAEGGQNQSSQSQSRGSHSNSFLNQLQKLRTILQNDDNDVIPSSTDSSGASLGQNTPRGGQNIITAASPQEKKQRSYKERVYAILSTYAPDKVDKVEGYLEKYKGQEDDLIEALVGKYGAEPVLSNEPQDTNVPVVPPQQQQQQQSVSSASPPSASGGNNNNNSNVAGAGNTPRATSFDNNNNGDHQKRDDLERNIANIQYQMQQMQSQLSLFQHELSDMKKEEEPTQQVSATEATTTETSN